MASSPTVVLVHGAFSDASGYGGVIRRLQSIRPRRGRNLRPSPGTLPIVATGFDGSGDAYVDGSHVAFVARPDVATVLILKGVAGE